jgi:hypothetical protein
MGKSRLKLRKKIDKPLKVQQKHKKLTPEELNEISVKKRKFLHYYIEDGLSVAKSIKKAEIKSQSDIHEWMKTDRIFKERYYRKRRGGDSTKPDIKIVKKEKPTMEKKVEELTIMQNSVIEAYRYSSFNLTEACNQTGITRDMVVGWMEDDPDFKDRLEQVDEEKKDLVESHLLAKVAQGDIAAIIFASKCLLKDRGYKENPDVVRARIDIVHSKEERDAVVAAAQIGPNSLLDTPGGKLLVERLNKNEGTIIDGEIVSPENENE